MKPSLEAETERDRNLRGQIVRAAFLVYRKLLSPVAHAVSGSSGACRFQPTCSEYAEAAIGTHGVLRGSALALRRLSKCHPFHPAECDPVPPKSARSAAGPQNGHFMHTSPPPVTMEETRFPDIPPASSGPFPAAPPHVR